jgi:recombination protein RecA
MAKSKAVEGREKDISDVLASVDKAFGKGAILRLGEDGLAHDFDVIPTGSFAIDNALGIGGVPKGRIVEIYGPFSSGKTSLTLHLAANEQKQGGVVAFIDAEHALDLKYAEALGVDIKNLLLAQPDSGEQALNMVQLLVESGKVDLVVVDSVAALVPQAELDGEMGDHHVALQARLMSQAMRKLKGVVNKSQCALVFINQTRDKIGGFGYGDPSDTPGGKALKYYASVRMEIKRIGSVKTGDVMTGAKTRVKVVKNKCAPPFREAEFEIVFGEGISRLSQALDLGKDFDIVDLNGAWYSYGELRLGQGKDNARDFLKENPDVLDEIEGKIREHFRNG